MMQYAQQFDVASPARISDEAAMIWMSGLAYAASGPHAAGQISASSHELAPIAAGRPPATCAIDPSRPSSPRTVTPRTQ